MNRVNNYRSIVTCDNWAICISILNVSVNSSHWAICDISRNESPVTLCTLGESRLPYVVIYTMWLSFMLPWRYILPRITPNVTLIMAFVFVIFSLNWRRSNGSYGHILLNSWNAKDPKFVVPFNIWCGLAFIFELYWSHFQGEIPLLSNEASVSVLSKISGSSFHISGLQSCN